MQRSATIRRTSDQLLVVLLAEHGDVGADQAEQLGDHGEHAAEVAGRGLAPSSTAPSGPGSTRDLRVAAGVDLLDRRREDDVDALLGADLEVGVEGARVAVEVLARRRTAAGSRRSTRPRRRRPDLVAGASRISAACPACSAPIVGTSADRPPARPGRGERVGQLVAGARDERRGSPQSRPGRRGGSDRSRCRAAASSSMPTSLAARIGSSRPSSDGTVRRWRAPSRRTTASVPGAVAAMSARWARTVSTSPRTIGPVSAASP